MSHKKNESKASHKKGPLFLVFKTLNGQTRREKKRKKKKRGEEKIDEEEFGLF